MAEEWPEGLEECYLVESYLEEQQPVTIRSPVDSGPQKIRRRYTQPITGVVTGISVDAAGLDTFWTWFNITLQGGVLSYNMTDPISQEIYEARFLQPPRVSPIDSENFILEFILERF